MQRHRLIFPALLVGVCLLLPALGAMVGYKFAGWQASRDGSNAVQSLGKLRDVAEAMRKGETMAGTFANEHLSLDGFEKCYYESPVDFTQIVWTGRDMPTPFVGFAPQPGPLPGGHINRQQFRYRKDLYIPKHESTCRIFLIGGSTAFGSGATTNETTVGGYLESQLNARAEQYGRRFEVVTAASCGWASTHERILVENRLVEMEPDVVIALSGHNDLHWGLIGRNICWYHCTQDIYYVRLINAMGEAQFYDSFPEDLPEIRPLSTAQTAGRLRRNVELTQSALERVGADYCFALQPILSCTRKARTPREQFMASRGGFAALEHHAVMAARYDGFRTALAGLKLPRFHFWDLTGIFDSVDSDVFIDNCHFGDRGYDLIAQDLAKRLEPILAARFKKSGR